VEVGNTVCYFTVSCNEWHMTDYC